MSNFGIEHVEHVEHLEHLEHLEHVEHVERVERLEHLEQRPRAERMNSLAGVVDCLLSRRLGILNLFMTGNLSADRGHSPAILDHDLAGHFPELLKFESTPELEASALYAEIRPEVERILNSIVIENFAAGDRVNGPTASEDISDTPGSSDPFISAVAWNLERGNVFDGIAAALDNHPDLKNKDLYLLTELDYGMARSGNRFVARELAQRLKLNYAFVPVYIALQKGSGVESQVEGENTRSIHGLAMFSRYPVKNVHSVPLPNGKDKMWGKEKRLGYLQALVADIEHPAGDFRAVTVHLDAHCSRAHRRMQIRLVLDHLETLPALPAIIGGDWNTTTYNSQSATRAILGYWRRVMMGVKNVAKNHLPHPQRYFEKPLFDLLEKRGYEWRKFNNVGMGTLHYDVTSIEKNTNLRDWVPEWCFPFIFWAARRVGGKVSGRLDWFTGKGIDIAPGSVPKTVGELMTADGTPLSDHDAITLDFVLTGRRSSV